MLIRIPVGESYIEGDLDIPAGARGIVIFAHGSGSSRHSSRNNFVAKILRKSGFGTLLLNLLTEQEDVSYENRFDISLLSRNLINATNWVKAQQEYKSYNIFYFGASTGAAVALVAAASLKNVVDAIVSRGGRPDLAVNYLGDVVAPTLFLVGGADMEVLRLNELAYDVLECEKQLSIIPYATHLFVEEGALEEVAEKTAYWFDSLM